MGIGLELGALSTAALGVGVTAIGLPLIYSYIVVPRARTRFPTLRNKRICLLIAHPDDEAMFFGPTLLALTQADTGNHVKILCLSTGNADDLGQTRRHELIKSAMKLGLRREDDVFVLDSPNFPDSMTKSWDQAHISSLLSSAFAPHLQKGGASAANAHPAIDVLITFDSNGVSSHPNHMSLYHGAQRFVNALAAASSDRQSPVDLYTLTSVNMLRKYSLFLDGLGTFLGLSLLGGPVHAPSSRGNPGVIMSASGLFGGSQGAATSRAAMTTAHQSQMHWFRWGWIGLSRYMVINDLRLYRPA